MASACVNRTGMSPENFLDCPPSKFQSYGRLSPRASFSREVMDDRQSSKASEAKHSSSSPPRAADKCGDGKQEDSDPEVLGSDAADFEFRLDRPEIMLPADELFSDGKLLPLQLPTIRLPATSTAEAAGMQVKLPDTRKIKTRNEISGSEPCLFSTKAPRCSSRWKELLGLKKLYQNRNVKDDSIKTTSPPLSSPSQSNSNHKSMKNFLQRCSKSLNSSIDESLSFPLLKDSDNESASNSSRLSLSSSSSGHENDDLPRISLDSEKAINLSRNPIQNINPPRVRLVKPRALSSENPAGRVCRSPVQRAPDAATIGGVSADSPRMNSSGKIVFHSLERSSSSPSSLNGEPRYKHRGMERSYSANVRVTRVLNVPVCSLRSSSKPGVFGFPLFSSSSQQKKEANGSSNGGNGVGYKNHQGSSRHRIKK